MELVNNEIGPWKVLEIEQISLQRAHMISPLISLNLLLGVQQERLHSIPDSTRNKFQCHQLCLITYWFYHDVRKDLFT